MKTTLASVVRTAVLSATLTLVTASVSAKDNATADAAAHSLTRNGGVRVKNAGPYVEGGTFLIQVAVKLGEPTAKLPDGTWLYWNYQVEDSAATGTLVVRFNRGRVSELALVTPTVATAMMAPKKSPDNVLVAAN